MNLLSLPVDVIYQYLSYLGAPDLYAFGGVCRQAHLLAGHDPLWQRFVSPFIYPCDPHAPKRAFRSHVTHLSRQIKELKRTFQGPVGFKCAYKGKAATPSVSAVVPHTPYLLCSEDAKILVYNCAQQKVIQVMEGHAQPIETIKFVTLGQKLIAVTLDSEKDKLIFWDCINWTKAGELSGDFGGGYGLREDEGAVAVVWITSKNALLWVRWTPDTQSSPTTVAEDMLSSETHASEAEHNLRCEVQIYADHPEGWMIQMGLIPKRGATFSYPILATVGMIDFSKIKRGKSCFAELKALEGWKGWDMRSAAALDGTFLAACQFFPHLVLWKGDQQIASDLPSSLGLMLQYGVKDCAKGVWCGVGGVPCILFPYTSKHLTLWNFESPRAPIHFSQLLQSRPLILEGADETLAIAYTDQGIVVLNLAMGETVAELSLRGKTSSNEYAIHAVTVGDTLRVVGVGQPGPAPNDGPSIHSFAPAEDPSYETLIPIALDRENSRELDRILCAFNLAVLGLILIGANRLRKRYLPLVLYSKDS